MKFHFVGINIKAINDQVDEVEGNLVIHGFDYIVEQVMKLKVVEHLLV